MVEIFGKKYEASPDDLELIKKISNLLESKGCTKTDLFFNTTEKLHAMEPSPESAYMMGNLCLTKQQYGKAAEYLKEAVEGTVAAGKAIATDAEIKGHVSAAVKAAPGAMTTAGQAIWQSLSGLGKFF